MLNLLLLLVAVLVCAAMDRLRGAPEVVPGWVPPVAGAVYGGALAMFLGVSWVYWMPVAGLWWLGEKPGWGNPWGRAVLGDGRFFQQHPDALPEWWQVLGLEDYAFESLMVRGAIWFVPVLPVAVVMEPRLFALLLMALAMPFGAWVEREWRRHQWWWYETKVFAGVLTPVGVGEAFRGAAMGAFIMLARWVL